MRIIGGELARRIIDLPKGLKLRPTTDIAKEALFSAITSLQAIEELRVLDLFAGTGSIGLEFLSRGASEVIFVEKLPRHAQFIKQTVKTLGLHSRSRIVVTDALRFLQRGEGNGSFDIIFADPPYDLPQIPEIPQLVFGSCLLARNGLLILEHPGTIGFIDQDPRCFKHKVYSAVNFSFFQEEAHGRGYDRLET